MKQQRVRTLVNISLALLLAVVCLVSLPAPGVAHVIGGNSWSAQIPVEQRVEVTSDLMKKDGQNIVLALLEDSRNIEIAIDVPKDVFWYVTATAEEGISLWTSEPSIGEWTYLMLDGVDNTYFNQGGGEQSITLNLMNQLPVIYVPEGEEAPAAEAVTAKVNVALHYITAAEVEALQQAAEQESAEMQTVEEGQEEGAPQDAEEATVLRTISATFYVPLREGSPATMLTGQLMQWPAQYHPSVAIPLTNGDADSELKLLNKDFPAMTQYTLGGITYLLYDGGTIRVPANESILLDFSLVEKNTAEEPIATATDIAEVAIEEISEETEEQPTEETDENNQEEQEEALTLFAGGREHLLAYAEAPALDTAKAPFIMTRTNLVLPVTYLWNNIAPTVSVEQLKADGETLVWEAMEDGRWNGSAEETLLKLSVEDGAVDAGTYRLTITWAENEMTLYSLQTVFYVRGGNL